MDHPTPLTRQQLDEGLANIEQSPREEGVVALIVRRPTTDAREILQSAELSLEVGLVGDNWEARGNSGTSDGSAKKDTQITLMNSRVAGLVAQSKDRWALAGDQLYLDLNLSEENLTPGTCLQIGTAILERTAEPHTGCSKFIARFGVDAMKFVNSERGRAMNLRGINAKVVQPGTIQTGDIARKVTS